MYTVYINNDVCILRQFFIVNSYIEILNLICFFNYLKLAEDFGQPRHSQPIIFQK